MYYLFLAKQLGTPLNVMEWNDSTYAFSLLRGTNS